MVVTMSFGKFRGTPVADLDLHYLLWVLQKSNLREYHPRVYREAARVASVLLRDVVADMTPLPAPRVLKKHRPKLPPVCPPRRRQAVHDLL